VSEYSIPQLGKLLADAARTDAYVEALRRTVTPTSVVADIGAGLGVFGLLACAAGARRVYALEPDPAIELARELAAANGFADRITFIEDLSTRIDFPEQADVVVSDVRGVTPLFRHHLPSIIDARSRLLAPGGVLIPARDTVWAALADAPDLYGRLRLWERSWYGLDLSRARHHVANTWRRVAVSPQQLVVEPQRWTVLDYSTIADADVRGDLRWLVERQAQAHGLAVWFDATLVEHVGFSSGPGSSVTVYGHAFFPFETPLALEPGDEVDLKLDARLVDVDYVWRWSTAVIRPGGEIKQRLDQSTFFSSPISPSAIQLRHPAHVPVLGAEGQIDRTILELIDGSKAVGAIAEALATSYPERFHTARDALRRVSRVVRAYASAEEPAELPAKR
jgi:type I protein arginine methyltransferase